MTSAKLFILLTLVNALLSVGMTSTHAAQAKHSRGARPGEAVTHKHPRASAPTNHQWLADPLHGWVRREESDETKEQSPKAKRRDRTNGSSNNKGKKY